jgi:hypothetical protein
MSDKDSRIVNSFSDRLAIERAVKDLAKARNAYRQDQLAKALAARGKPVLSALLRNLEASDPTLRGGLGRLAQHLDPNLVIPALRQAAMDVARSDAARLTAVMLLERYLGQEIDPALARRIPASYDVARESGEEAIAIAETEPLVLVEYAEQLLDEPPEIVQAVLQVIKDMEDPRRVRLLMVIAAYGDPELQQDILAELGVVRHPLSVQALQTLWHLVTPELQPQVRRQLQKLRLSGVQEEAPGDLRALWSPVNAQGHSFLWLVHTKGDEPVGDLLVLILHDQLGVVYASAYPDLDREALPLPAPVGATHNVPMVDSAQRVLMAEIAPALGLKLLDDALQSMALQAFPWPGEIVVFGHWLWSGRALPLPEVSWPRLPKPAVAMDAKAARAILDHAAFAGWVWTLPDLEYLLRGHDAAALEKNGALHQRIVGIMLNEDNRPLLSQRLLQQARWLMLSKDRRTASSVLAVRDAVDAGDSENPFVRKLAWRSLLTAAADRAMRYALKSINNQDDLSPEGRTPPSA